jgi:hypothetical protein
MLLLYFVYHSTHPKNASVPPEENLTPYWNKLVNEVSNKTGKSIEQVINEIKTSPSDRLNTYEHYLHLNIREINEYNPAGKLPSEVFAYFEKLEKEWAKDLAGTIPYLSQPISDDENDEDNPDNYGDKNVCFEVMDFSDGWYWVDLNTNHCTFEKNAMGHCATADRDHTLLSLRYLNKRRSDPDSWLWEPHLTFEYDGNTRMLYQMKGKGNDKPAQRYHKYIVALLTHKVVMNSKGDTGFYIKGIRRGSYDPKSDFSLDDLTTEEVDKVIAENPNLDILAQVIEKFGEERVKVDGTRILISKFPVVGKKYSDLELIDLYHESGRDCISKDDARQMCSGESDNEDYYNDYSPDFDDIVSWHTVNKSNQQKIEAWLDEEYSDWREEDDDWEKYVNENNIDEIIDVVKNAYSRAEEQANSDAKYKDFEKSVDASPYIVFDSYEYYSLLFDKKKDITLITDLIEEDSPNANVSYGDDPPVCWTWSYPHDGWQGTVKTDDFNDQLSDTIHDL